VIGYLKYVQVGKSPIHWIAVLYVWPRFRGMGIGEALVRYVIGLAQEEHAGRLFCTTRRHETRILELLHKLGFQDESKVDILQSARVSRSSHPVEEVTLRLDLSEKSD